MVDINEMLQRWSDEAHRASNLINYISWGLIRYDNDDIDGRDLLLYLDRCECLIRQLEALSKEFREDYYSRR